MKYLVLILALLIPNVTSGQTVTDVPEGARFQFIWEFTAANLTTDKVVSFYVRIDNQAPVSSGLPIVGGTFLYAMPENLPVGTHTVAVKGCIDITGLQCGLESSATFRIVAKPVVILPRAPSTARIHVG